MSGKQEFLARHGLAENYLQQAAIWFDSTVEIIIKHQNSARKAIVIGINGCQGSGKTTLADYLCMCLADKGLKAVSVSIDDFYLTRQERQKLALDVHPLFLTRGVPGTHDLALAIETLQQLSTKQGTVEVPKFNKAQDDRFPKDQWQKVEAPVDVIILEGWCVGITAEQDELLENPINDLEAKQDPEGIWRRYINHQLIDNYPTLWKQIDRLIMLQAPSFNCVYQWRLEQEQKLEKKEQLKAAELNISKESGENNQIMSSESIHQFIQHYERLTRHALKNLPKTCQHVFQLTDNRQIVSYQTPNPLTSDTQYGLQNVVRENLGGSL